MKFMKSGVIDEKCDCGGETVKYLLLQSLYQLGYFIILISILSIQSDRNGFSEILLLIEKFLFVSHLCSGCSTKVSVGFYDKSTQIYHLVQRQLKHNKNGYRPQLHPHTMLVNE